MAEWTAAALQSAFLDDVYRYVRRSVARREEAEDVTAEVFAAAFERLSSLRREDSPKAWLIGIARRKVADHLRRSSRRRETLAADLEDVSLVESGSTPDDPGEVVAKRETVRELRRLVAALPPDQRDALLLQYVDGLSIAEIGRVLGRSTAAANSLLQRARGALQRSGAGYFSAPD